MPEKLAVVVRSHNDGAFIDRTLDALLRQSCVPDEILCVDDGSTDGTAESIDRRGAPVRRVKAPRPYVPGRVLNFAVRECRAERIVFNNADAVPLDEFLLERLTAPLADAAVGATFANQCCRPDAEALVRKDHERAFGDGATAAKWRDGFFSLASSAARRELLTACPFDEELQYSEDVEWSRRVIARGLKVVYVAEARVEHSHNYSPAELYKRFYNEGVAEARIFGAPPGFFTVLRRFVMECLRDARYLVARREWGAFAAVFGRRFRQKFGCWRGRRAGWRKRK